MTDNGIRFVYKEISLSKKLSGYKKSNQVFVKKLKNLSEKLPAIKNLTNLSK
jgi:hypothetical protein